MCDQELIAAQRIAAMQRYDTTGARSFLDAPDPKGRFFNRYAKILCDYRAFLERPDAFPTEIKAAEELLREADKEVYVEYCAYLKSIKWPGFD
jgi:hypothetical protein